MAGSVHFLPLPMRQTSIRSGFSLLETILFLGILSIMTGTIVAVYIATQEARIRQRSVAELEQTGIVVLETMTKNIRRAEKILAPTMNATGSILTLQMAKGSEYPTIFSPDPAGNLVRAQKTSTAALLTPHVTMSHLVFRNIADISVAYSFDLTITIPTVVPMPYVRTLSATVTLFPDNQNEAGGCGSCPAPSCTNHAYLWYICTSGVCEQSSTIVPC